MSENKVSAPIAEKIEKKLTIHNDVRIDNYYWLNQKENPKVIDYLNAENAYYEAKTAHTKTFQEDLFEEMKSRIKEDDESVPYKKNNYYYTTRFETGKQYPIYSRKKESLEAVEEIMFEVNKLAEGYNFYKLSGLSISPNNKYAAFGVDTVGRREYTLQFKNLETGELFPEKIKNSTGGAAWATDNKTIFYTQKNPTTLRSEKIFRHILGTDPSLDIEVFYENEEAFSTYVYRTKSDKYLIIGSHSSVSTEYRILEADNQQVILEYFKLENAI